MKQRFYILFLLISFTFLNACTRATYHENDRLNPDTGKIEQTTYSPYFQLKNELIPQQLEFTLVAQLNSDSLRSLYRLKEKTRRLLPNDYMDDSDVFLYLKNTSSSEIMFQLNNISIHHERLPLSQRSINIASRQSMLLPMGQIKIDLRKTSLLTSLDYTIESRQLKEFDMQRLLHNEALADKNKSETGETPPENNDDSVIDKVSDWFESLGDKLFD